MVAPGVVLPRAELAWRFSHASGPGGQSVNTSDTRVELLFDLAASPSVPEHLKERAIGRLGARLVAGVLTVTASRERSQLRNRHAAEERLVAMLTEAMAVPPRPRRPTRPSRGAVRARLESKRRRSQTKQTRRRPDE